MAYVVGAFLCGGVIAAVAGYCVDAVTPTVCHSQGGWEPGRTSVQCSFGGVPITFYNGILEDYVTIYTPKVTYQADYGVNEAKVGPIQTSLGHVYSVTNCVQTITDITWYWYGCCNYVPDDDSGDCEPAG